MSHYRGARGLHDLEETPIVVLVSVAENNGLYVTGLHAGMSHQIQELPAHAVPARVNQKRPVRVDQVVPSWPEVPIPSVQVLGADPENLPARRQLQPEDHLVASTISIRHDLNPAQVHA